MVNNEIRLIIFFGCKEYNQSDLGIDHLVMSMCESSLVLLEYTFLKNKKEKDFFDKKYISDKKDIFINTFLKNQNLILIDIKAICLDPFSPRVLCSKINHALFPKYPILSI